LQVKLRETEARVKMIESDLRGTIDLAQLGKPAILDDDE